MGVTIRDFFKVEYKHRTVAQEACLWLGFAFLAVGIVGFIVQSLQGSIQSSITTGHINRTHDVMRALFGALSIEMGLNKYAALSERFARYAGMILGFSAIAGFIIGSKGSTPVLMGFPSLGMESFLVRMNFFKIQFGTIDHLLHLFAGAVLFISTTKKARD